MHHLTVSAAAIHLTPLAWESNLVRIKRAIAAARAAGSTLVVLPELSITGYGCEDRFAAPDVHERALRSLYRCCEATSGMVVVVGLPIRHQNILFNCVAVIIDGRVIGLVAKQYLPNDGVHYEQRYFHEWPGGVQDSHHLGPFGYSVPIGDLLFDIGGVRLGCEICEDAWVNERPGAGLSARGAEIIVNPSASHFALRKHEIRKRFVLEGSRAFNCAYIYTNHLGCEAGRILYDGGSLIASCGTLIAQGERLALTDITLTSTTIDLDRVRVSRARTVSSKIAVGESSRTVTCPFDWPSRTHVAAPLVEPPLLTEEVEFTKAVTRGAYDYLRKSRSQGYLISLSGGADSSTSAVLIRYLAERLVEELTPAELVEQLGFIAGVKESTSVEALVRSLLTCVYLRTRNSSEETEHAAQSVAAEIGANYFVGSVDEIIKSSVGLVSGWLGRELPWERDEWGKDDLPLQNVQARARAVVAWLLANCHQSILLTTSNRSEAAVGYCTMDGDTAGGLNLIGGIAKSFIWRWLAKAEVGALVGFSPIKTLSLVASQKAKAELRPLSKGQSDEEDLGPYVLRDQLEQHAIQDWKSPLECLHLLINEFTPQFTITQLAQWVDLFFTLWSRNQWKRERFAPFFHLDDRNLDPRTWCRFPILSGGFKDELREMWSWVEMSQPTEGEIK